MSTSRGTKPLHLRGVAAELRIACFPSYSFDADQASACLRTRRSPSSLSGGSPTARETGRLENLFHTFQKRVFALLAERRVTTGRRSTSQRKRSGGFSRRSPFPIRHSATSGGLRVSNAVARGGR